MSDDQNAAGELEDDQDNLDEELEMEVDDEFSQMHTPVTKLTPAQQQHTPQLEVPRSRGPVQRMAAGGGHGNFAINGARAVSHPGPGPGSAVDMSQPMPNAHPTMYGHHGHHAAHSGMTSLNVKRDPVYME